MSGFRISRQTREYQRSSVKQIKRYKKRIMEVVKDNPTRLMNITDIAREACNNPTDQAEVGRVAQYVGRMKRQGLIDMSGGKQKGYWSEVRHRERVAPTYQPKEVEQPEEVIKEADEEEQAPTEASAEDVRAEEQVKESPTVKVPVQRAPIFQDVIPVRKQPVQVNREPRKITITIEL